MPHLLQLAANGRGSFGIPVIQEVDRRVHLPLCFIRCRHEVGILAPAIPSRFDPTAHSSPPARLGARRRSDPVPCARPHTADRLAARRRLTRSQRGSGPKVLYFVDTYANYYDVALAESLVHVLEHNNVAVYVPPDQWHSAMPLIAQGALDPAIRIASHNVELLADAVRQGYTILATEPSAVQDAEVQPEAPAKEAPSTYTQQLLDAKRRAIERKTRRIDTDKHDT